MSVFAWVGAGVRGRAVGAAGIVTIGATAGCASLPGMTSGQIGCAADNIAISDVEWASSHVKTWKAECLGRHYFCTVILSRSEEVSCKQDADEAAGVVRPSTANDARRPTAADPAEASEREDTRVCEAAYAHVGEFATFWAARSPGSKALDELPQQRDFAAVCHAMPESVQRCMHSGFLAIHKKACEAVLLRLEPPVRNRIDGLFLEAETTDHK